MITFSDGNGIDESSFKLYFGTTKNKGVELKKGSDYTLDYNKSEKKLYVSIKKSKKDTYEVSSGGLTYFYVEVNDASDAKQYYKGDFSVKLDEKGDVKMNKAPDTVYPVTIKNDKGKFESKKIAFRCNDSTGISNLYLKKATGDEYIGSKGKTGWSGTDEKDWRDIIEITSDKKNVKDGITTFEKLSDLKSAKTEKHKYRVAIKTKDKNGVYSFVSTTIDTSYVKKMDSSENWQKIVSSDDAEDHSSGSDNDQSGNGTNGDGSNNGSNHGGNDGGNYGGNDGGNHGGNDGGNHGGNDNDTETPSNDTETPGGTNKNEKDNETPGGEGEGEECEHDWEVKSVSPVPGAPSSTNQFLVTRQCTKCGEISTYTRTKGNVPTEDCLHPEIYRTVSHYHRTNTDTGEEEYFEDEICTLCGLVIETRNMVKANCPVCKGGPVHENDQDSFHVYVGTGNPCEYIKRWHCKICSNQSDEPDLYYKHEAMKTAKWECEYTYRQYNENIHTKNGAKISDTTTHVEVPMGPFTVANVSFCSHCGYLIKAHQVNPNIHKRQDTIYERNTIGPTYMGGGEYTTVIKWKGDFITSKTFLYSETISSNGRSVGYVKNGIINMKYDPDTKDSIEAYLKGLGYNKKP